MHRMKWYLAPLVTVGLATLATTAPAAPVATPARTLTPHTTTHPATHATVAKSQPTLATHHTANNTLHKTTGTGTTNANANPAIGVLQQAHTLLAGANHDYDGHRARAAEHISHAIRELGGHHQGQPGANAANKLAGNANAINKVASNGNGNAKGNAMREPQAQSDAQLQQAIKLLSGVQVPNTHKAATHVQTAITELNTALKIR